LRAFAGLLRLTGDGVADANVKVFFTSTPGTNTIRAVFEEQDLILEVGTLSGPVTVPSEEKILRQWEGE